MVIQLPVDLSSVRSYTHSLWDSLEHPGEGSVESKFMWHVYRERRKSFLESIQLRGYSEAPLLGMFTEFSKAKPKEGLLLNVSLPNSIRLREAQRFSGTYQEKILRQ